MFSLRRKGTIQQKKRKCPELKCLHFIYVLVAGYVSFSAYFLIKFSLLASHEMSVTWLLVFLKSLGLSVVIKTSLLVFIAHPLIYFKRFYKSNRLFKFLYDTILDGKGVMLSFKIISS